ncbi:MAG: hypothetical protein ABI298_07380 [Acidimicrobiales bacterium]
MTQLISENDIQHEFHAMTGFPLSHEAEQLLIKEARRRQRRRQRWIAAIVAAVVAAAGLVYAMASGTASPRRSPTNAQPVSLTAFPTCLVKNLHASFGGASGAAGTDYYALKLVNNAAVCTVPPIAVRGFDISRASYVGPWSKVYVTSHAKTVVASGHAVYVPVGVGVTGNWPTSLCKPINVTALSVVEAGNRAVIADLPLRVSVCTITQSLHTQSASRNPND